MGGRGSAIYKIKNNINDQLIWDTELCHGGGQGRPSHWLESRISIKKVRI